MKNWKFISLFIFISFLAMNTRAQKGVNLWPGAIPGAKPEVKYTPIMDTTGGWTRILRVSHPTIDIYRAANAPQNAATVLICPGGGYGLLAIKHEGEDVAKWFNILGMHAVVLKYRLPEDATMEKKCLGPLQDAQEAMRYIRRHAAEWHADPNKVGVMGFSAGGHLAATLSTHYADKVYAATDQTSARPDFSILIYPVISMELGVTHQGSRDNLLGKAPQSSLVEDFSNEKRVDAKTPPAFLVHSIDDGLVPCENSIRYAMSLKNEKVPCELHLYSHGGHGYGMGRSTDTESTWPQACVNWLQMMKFKISE